MRFPRRCAVAEIARLSTRDADFDTRLARLTAFEAAQDQTVDRTVAEILAAVKSRGDAAVLEYTARFDGVTAAALAELELPRAMLARARDALP
ncbi:MAG: histidinol dehydrogenase, partial [Burkholderiales bacterium]|nr:histidinol dehydrogenase [Burkholderiales bacterium]